jgi:hexosaminidase
MKNTIHWLITKSLWLISIAVYGQEIAIIPEPVKLFRSGGHFTLTSATQLIIHRDSQDATNIAEHLRSTISPATGFKLGITKLTSNGIHLKINDKFDVILGAEGYTLDIDSLNIFIQANSAAGLFYATQTLLQLMPGQIESNVSVNRVWKIPTVKIVDYPRFQWRGLLLDVSRHFFSKEYVKEFIVRMARYKYNRFHWHLTDDNGWRVEIKRYPLLTEVGAWRVPRIGAFGNNEPPRPEDEATYGGYYTQEDIKEIVHFAKQHFIEIIPEVDFPGHSMAALAAYPELGVTKDSAIKVDPGTDFAKWHPDGTFEMSIENTLNPTDDGVYEFVDNVYSEIADLFPFEYIHIGGDECYKGFWERDPAVQSFMKKHDLKTGLELQSYFTKRVCAMITSKNKKPVGWDEILEGGSSPEAAIMSWRGVNGGKVASQAKRNVIMTPAPFFYLDMCQGDPSIEPPATYLAYNKSRLRDTYNFDILTNGIDSAFVLGGQGNLWTEQVPSSRQVEYMTYPRAFAIAETVWSPKGKKDWSHFSKKVEKHFKSLDIANVHYATSMYDAIINVSANSGGELEIQLETEIDDLDIFYTFDNTIPNKYSSLYEQTPIKVPRGANSLRVITYRDGQPCGRLITLSATELTKRSAQKKDF